MKAVLFMLGGYAIGGIIVWLWYHLKNKKTKPTIYHVKVHFAHGIKIKLILNEGQYQQFQETMVGYQDGFFDVGDEFDKVQLNREFICLVEVKKK